MKIFYGQYTGNGTTQGITGVGFQPTCVIVKDQTNGNNGIFRTSSMTALASLSLREDSGAFSTGIITLDADGFTVSTDGRANTNADVYNYVAITDNGDGDFKVGTWVGNSTDNRAITGFGFKPCATFIKGDLGRTGSSDALQQKNQPDARRFSYAGGYWPDL